MQLLKDLLEATIKYQDVIDSEDYGLKANLKIDMLEKMDEAAKKFPETISRYNFTDYPATDFLKEFDYLQEFISDFRDFENKIDLRISYPEDSLHYNGCCYGCSDWTGDDFINECNCNMTKELSDYYTQLKKETSA
jgi:hypothetical protein